MSTTGMAGLPSRAAHHPGCRRFRYLCRHSWWTFGVFALFNTVALKIYSQQTNLAVIVRHAPNLNGSGLIEGSVQQLLAGNVTLGGGFNVTGDLLVPGMPTLNVKGTPTFAGTLPGSGSDGPTNYQVTLNGNCSLNHLRMRTAPISLPAVSAPPQPSGTRVVTINSVGESIGDASTLRNLVLKGDVGQYTIPPGTYGDFTASGGSGFILGVEGSLVPTIYHLQNLTLHGLSRIEVVGPVILTLANGISANGILGSTNHPTRLQLQIASGGLTLNGGCSVFGSVTVPAGTVVVSGNSLIVGSVQCDRLVVNSGGIVRAIATANQPPVATSQSLSVAEDGGLNIILMGSDAEGATLTYVILSEPGHGRITGNVPNLLYEPVLNFEGTDSFSFKVNDGQSDSATATISILVSPVNDVPIAQAQTVSTPEDVALAITLSANDVENSPLTFEIVTMPEHGELSGTPPNLTYTPAPNYSGSDSFTYVANDGGQESAAATVAIGINAVGDAPVASDRTVSTDEDVSVNIRLTAVDIEGEGLDFTLLTLPVHGSLSGTPPDLLYTPTTNFNGNDRFTFHASSALLTSEPAVVTLIVRAVNDMPIGMSRIIVTPEDTATNVVLSAIDVDGDTLSYLLESQPANGTFSGTAPELVFSPAADFHGTNVFTFVAVDGVSTSSPVAVTLIVTPMNDPPVADVQSLSLVEDTSAVITLTGADVDGDALTYVITTPPTNGILTFNSQTSSSNAFTYTPHTNFYGADSFSFAINDGAEDSTPAAFTLTIAPVNDPPVNADLFVSTDEDSATIITLTGSDVEDDPLTFAVLMPPLNGTVTGTAPHLTYTPHLDFNGTDSFTYQSDDGITNSAVSTVNITVNSVNDAPKVTAGPDLRITAGQPVQLNGAATDDATPAGVPLTAEWIVSSGAGAMQFDSPTSAVTMARFDEVGTYIVRLTANDSVAEVFDEAVITVIPVNRAPVITVGPKQLVLQPSSVDLNTTVSDDGLPEGATISVVWSKVSGPGIVSFSNPATKDTTATFSETGDYVLRLTANDSALSSFADVRIAVRTPAMNEPPVASVGNDLVVGLTNVAVLNAVISDDGLPQAASTSVLWSQVSGPGTATFENASSAITHVTFDVLGTYVLRATASDSELSGTDDVTVTVYPHNQPPVVDAGEDQTVTLPAPELLYPNPFAITNVKVSLSRSLFSVDRWNSAIGQPGLDQRTARNSIAIGDSVFVTGNFQSAGGKEAHGSARWDGSEWFPLYDPRVHLNDNYDLTITNIAYFVYDCGTFTFCNQILECVGARGQEAFVGGLGKNLAYSDIYKDMSARWSGNGWESWVFKHSGNHVRDIKATANMVYLGGHFAFQPTNATDQTITNLPWSYGVATWDGTNWGTLGSGVPDIRDTPHPSVPGLNQYHHYVSSIAVATNGDLYVAGDFLMPTPTGIASNVAKWNGASWQPLGSGLKRTGSFTTGMALGDNGDLYVGGMFTNAGGYSVRNIARWDGTRWWPVGDGPANGVNGAVEAIAVYGRDVYVGGSYSEAGGLPANDLAKWNGQFWSPLGHVSSNGVLGEVLSLAVDATGLYVGGSFTKAGGLPANNIAKWEFTRPPPREIELRGVVSDDGLPYGGVLTRQWTKLSGPGEVTFADSQSAYTTAAFSKAGTYVLQLTANDSDLAGQDEVTVTIRANQPPEVAAGPDHVIGLEAPLALSGYVTDDGLPEGAPVHHVWQQIYGPGTVTFDNVGNTNVTARFSQQGTYVLRLSANDSQFSAVDEITVIVRPRNNPPNVFPGSFAIITLGNSHKSNATVTDDGYPTNGSLSVAWSVVSGPGTVRFDDAGLVQPVFSFSTNGIYILRLTATDSELTSTADVQINVSLPVNNPPVVNAGPDQTLMSFSTRLQGTVSDDGKLLTSALEVFWSRSASATGVAFANSNSPTTTVTFNQSGSYNLTLTARDGTYTVSDLVTVTIPNQPPLIVDAGPDRAITLPTNALSLTGYLLDTSPSTYQWSRLAGPGTATFAGATTLTPTVTFSATGTNIIRLRVTDGAVNYDDTMTVVVAPAGNVAPAVNAGQDRIVSLPTNSITLSGTVTDDGSPAGNSVTLLWTQVAGPPAVISDPSSLDPELSLTGAGMHIFRLSATDGSLTNGDEVVITVQPQMNQPPQVFAGNDIITRVTNTIVLVGTVIDDGLPVAGGLSAFWRELSGPGTVTFGSPSTNSALATNLAVQSSVTFSLPGTYVLRLQADDAEYTAADDLMVHVLDVDDNQPPLVSAGLDASTVVYAPFILSGSLTDDGLPVGASVSVMWSFVSGPARVYFSDATVLMPYAQFSVPGTYRLRLLANDTQLTAFDDVIITVSAPTNQPPVVFAGLPLEVTRPFPALLQGVILDDGLPIGYPLVTTWSKVAGPGTVTFVPNANDALAAAYFSVAGEYTLRLEVNDSEFAVSDEMTVLVLPGTNAPPLVDAGPDFVATLSIPANLSTTVSDDGLEEGLLLTTWSVVSGPGTAGFSTLNGDYRASFTASGEYVLRLTATDGALTNTDDVVVIVYDDPAPVAEIMLPSDSAIITAPSAIVGTASSAILRCYLVEFRLKPAEDSINSQLTTINWSVLSSNTVSITSNTLAVFDPTLLLNGIYEVRLTATDLAGRSSVSEPITVIVDRNLKIGHFTISFNDLAVPVPGLPLQITRTYDSRAAAAGIQGDFGIGWTLDIRNVRLQKNRPLSRNWEQTTTGSPFNLSLAYHLDTGKPRIVTITFPDGRVEKFQFVPYPMDQALLPIDYPQWRFVPLGNTRGSLVPAGYDDPDGRFLFFAGSIPGTADLYDLNYFSDWLSSSATEEELRRYPTLFRYTSAEGYKYLIDEVLGLQSVTDPNNNTLLISTNGLTWTNSVAGTNSLSIAFLRDSVGRITNIVDAAGHGMTYVYGTTGNLIAYTDRVGHTNGFAYIDTAFPHHLTGIIDPRGITPVSNDYDGNGRLVGNTDALGNTISYGHELANNREYVTNRLGHVTISEYDGHGNVTRVIDPLGGKTLSAYDDNGNLLATVDTLGRTNSYTYDSLDNRLTATDPLGNTTAFTYGAQRRVTSVIDPRGNSITNVFDARGNLLSIRDPLGNVTRFAYDSRGLPITMTNALGSNVRFVYDHHGRLTAETNVLGHGTAYQRDANGNLLVQTTTRSTSNGSETLTVQFNYDAQGRLTNSIFPDGSSAQTIYNSIGKAAVTIDQQGRQTAMEYDVLGRIERTIYPDGSVEPGGGYDAEGRRIASTSRLGQVTRYEYDANGRLFRTILADGSSTTNWFDLAGQMIASTDARGYSTFYGYDAAGRTTSVTNALGEVNLSFYDAAGNLTNSVDALGRSTRFVYDLLNRRVQTILADGTAQTTWFDALGRRTHEQDQAGQITAFAYDALGRLTAVTNALGYVTSYAYDELGQQISQTDANQHTTRFEYDSLGRRVSRTLPGNQVERYAYNLGGLLTNKTDFNGFSTAYQYDVMNRLLAKIPDRRRGEPSVTYGYNVLGLRTNMTDASGGTAYTYDDRNQLMEKTRTWSGQAVAVRLAYRYDANGNLTNIVSSSTNGVSVGYEYDALNRLSAVNDASVGRTVYTYDSIGNLKGYTYPNLVHTEHAYDALNRLTNLASGRGFTAIANYAYAVGAAGNRTNAIEQLFSSVLNSQPKTINRLYTHDEVYRLTGETINDTAAVGTLGYSYDPVGNRQSRAVGSLPLQPQTFTFDANDRLSTDSYDANGNTLLAAGFSQFQPDQYDFENRLISRVATVNGQATTINISYDGDGNRVKKSVVSPTNTVTTFYVVDELNPSGYAQVLEELTPDSQPSTPAVTRVYTYGHTLISQDRLDGTQWVTSFYGYDGHNNVRYLTDLSGNVTDTYDYDAFGNLIAGSSISDLPTPNSYLFTGEQYDADLGLYYLRARYHNPAMGRFWTQDSFEGDSNDPSSLHRYIYGGNNPVNCSDPSGKYSIPEMSISTGLWSLARGIFGASVGGITGSLTAGYDSILHGKTGNQEIAPAMTAGFQEGATAGAFFGAVGSIGKIGQFGVSAIGMVYSGIGFLTAYQSYLNGSVEAAAFEGGLSVFGSVLSAAGLTRALSRMYSPSYFEPLAQPKGTTYQGTLYRYELPHRIPTTWQTHMGNIMADHRYTGSMRPGVYGSTSPDTAFAEVSHYRAQAGRVLVSRSATVENVLDLTNSEVRSQLGIKLYQIIGDDYSITHQIGDWARAHGYDGILFPSARHPAGRNLVVFRGF